MLNLLDSDDQQTNGQDVHSNENVNRFRVSSAAAVLVEQQEEENASTEEDQESSSNLQDSIQLADSLGVFHFISH